MRISEDDGITFDDVLLKPNFSNILPTDASLGTQLTRKIHLNIPLVSAAMDTVTEARLAIALAQEGGIGIIHKNMSIAEQAAQVRKVKKYESGIVKDPITVEPETTVRELLTLTRKHNISGVPVVKNEQLQGIVTSRDVRFETELDRPISEVMTPKERLITVPEGTQRNEVLGLLHTHRIEKLLVVNNNFQLRGLITVKDIQKAKQKPKACKDDAGQLRVGAAVGTSADTDERVAALIAAGVDVLVVDTAHGHSQRVLDRIMWVKKHYPAMQVIGGNVATAQGAQALIDAGVDGVKVGIGPGSICTTRIISGVGVPQLTAISSVLSVTRKYHIPLIADGGIRYSGDICKAIAAGADAVMIGSLFAGTEESPGEVELYKGRAYKLYRGMGSLGAMSQAHGSSDRYFQDLNSKIEKLVPEGVEGRVPYKGSVSPIIYQITGGLQSCMGYLGCLSIDEMHKKAEFVRVSHASMRESHVHDVTITKEAPNYPMDDER
jgi:IMP dehydrogenase